GRPRSRLGADHALGREGGPRRAQARPRQRHLARGGRAGFRQDRYDPAGARPLGEFDPPAWQLSNGPSFISLGARMKHVQVLIAGGGPVGMTLARDLARRDIACLLVERNPGTTRHPKMDITNARSMELFRRLALADQLRAAAVPESGNFDVSWITSLSGHELHRFRYPSVTEWRRLIRATNDGSMPGEPSMRVSQVEIEPVLQRCITAEPRVEARWSVAFDDLTQDAEGVTVTLRAADGQTEQIRCSYLIGCDGGGSRVRGCLGISLNGQFRVAHRFMTHFRSAATDVLQRFGMAWHYQSTVGTLI